MKLCTGEEGGNIGSWDSFDKIEKLKVIGTWFGDGRMEIGSKIEV